MYYVADTHALLWYFIDNSKLSREARRIFDLCDQGKVTIIVSAIVLLECIDVLDKKKVNLKFREIISKITQASNFIFSEINWSLILEVDGLKGLKDLHDRVIVATAKSFDTPLISRDRTIKRFYKKTVW